MPVSELGIHVPLFVRISQCLLPSIAEAAKPFSLTWAHGPRDGHLGQRTFKYTIPIHIT